MNYENIKKARFINRPNRFIANVLLEGKIQVCHVKNTGRCRELLTKNAEILIQEVNSTTRKTKFDLISVWKGETLINMDSAAPNEVFGEWLKTSGFFKNVTLIKPEQIFGRSRLDFYFEADDRCAYVEVKGVTLEENGIARFPDAPTERGLKHIYELIKCKKAGFDAYAVFIIQMKGVHRFEPNWDTQEAFGQALRKADAAGVKLLALDCVVTETTVCVDKFVEIHL